MHRLRHFSMLLRTSQRRHVRYFQNTSFYLTTPRRFAELSLSSDLLQRLEQQNLSQMTEIQEKTFDPIIHRHNIVARARTGTGKTIAFLLPSIAASRRTLILLPTRELAHQIYSQASALTPHAQVMFGGTPRKRDIHHFRQKQPLMLIATPGRLLDHLTSADLKDDMRSFLDSTETVVLDEMDRLLDLGFREDIRNILNRLPSNCQKLMFSATIPPELHDVLPSQYTYVDLVGEDDPSEQTNQAIRQTYAVLPSDRLVTGLIQILMGIIPKTSRKIIVFFPTTAHVNYFSRLFNCCLGIQVLALHSKLSQVQRQLISERFRSAKASIILFTSDVSARGMDYPNVSHVIQYGSPSDRATYLHRLGRTGRAQQCGEGILLLTELDQNFLTSLHGLDVSLEENIQQKLRGKLPLRVYDEIMKVHNEMSSGYNHDLLKDAQEAYKSMLGAYQTRIGVLGKTVDDLAETVNNFASAAGLVELPTISSRQATMLGLSEDYPNLNIRTPLLTPTFAVGGVALGATPSQKPRACQFDATQDGTMNASDHILLDESFPTTRRSSTQK